MKDVTLDLTGIKNLEKRLSNLENTAVEYGFFEDDKYGAENANLQVAQVAFWQEFGTDNGIPERPFFQTSVKNIKNNKRLKLELKRAGNRIMHSLPWNPNLRLAGNQLIASLQKEIIIWSNPENAESTENKKGFNDPLIESGKMLDSVKYKITKVE